MDILQRYLHAIEFWLPAKQKQDIIAEISEDIHSQIEERHEQLGRALNESELEGLIKQRGRPVLVANRYLPQQSLIGPVLFPVYVFFLKICVLFYLLPWTAVHVVVERIQHPAVTWMHSVTVAIGSLWTGAFIGAATITLIFAALEWVEAKSRFLENWDPRQLPPVRHPNKIARTSSAIEVVVNLAFALWLISKASSLDILTGPAVTVTLEPIWMHLIWGYVIIALLNCALAAANLMRPHWTTTRALFRLAMDAAGSILFCWLLKANIIARISIPGSPASHGEAIRSVIHFWLAQMFPFAVIVAMVIFVIDLYRVIRVSRKGNAGLFITPAEVGGSSKC